MKPVTSHACLPFERVVWRDLETLRPNPSFISINPFQPFSTHFHKAQSSFLQTNKNQSNINKLLLTGENK
jgi:hypothetical protein